MVPDAKDPRIEEIVFGENDSSWVITLSYVRIPTPRELAGILGGKPPRIYKSITIDRETGTFVSMKIRQLA